MALVPCDACARHVRISDSGCPFCGATRIAGTDTPRRLDLARATRAMLVFGSLAALAEASQGCASPTAPPAEAPILAPVAMYGAPPELDASSPPPAPTAVAPETPPTPSAKPSAYPAEVPSMGTLYGLPPGPQTPPSGKKLPRK